tara:strand:- start:60 stop:416 length:357 start_codon:yes stop_codon:yes gene_type:complete
MNKFLYFASAAPDGTSSTEQVAMFPVANISHFEMHSATALRVYFNSGQESDEDSGIDRPVVVLTVTTGKHKEALQDISGAINGHPNLDPCIVIADTENSVFCSSHITACASVAVVDAS